MKVPLLYTLFCLLPGHSTIVQPFLSVKLDPESGSEVVFVLTVYYGTMGVLEQVWSPYWDLEDSR